MYWTCPAQVEKYEDVYIEEPPSEEEDFEDDE